MTGCEYDLTFFAFCSREGCLAGVQHFSLIDDLMPCFIRVKYIEIVLKLHEFYFGPIEPNANYS